MPMPMAATASICLSMSAQLLLQAALHAHADGSDGVHLPLDVCPAAPPGCPACPCRWQRRRPSASRCLPSCSSRLPCMPMPMAATASICLSMSAQLLLQAALHAHADG